MGTDMQNFYKSKTIFVTGGTGFMGKVLIEKILRDTDVERIYVLMRPKKEKNMHERLEEIFKDPLFERLHKLKSNWSKRVYPIFGDCCLPGLGISKEDCAALIEQVDVVVHGAATVRFNENLNKALTINVGATVYLLQLAKRMTKLKSFVHVSSAYANCIETHVEERYYEHRIGITAENILKMADIVGPDVMSSLSDDLRKDFPNTYCFTKALAEEAVLTQGSELPICIFRPAIVFNTVEEPIPGWIDNYYGPMGSVFGGAYGVIHTMYMWRESSAGIVPVDFCASTILAAACKTAKSVKQISNSPPPIYNLVPDENNCLKWGQYLKALKNHAFSMPLTDMMWFPFVITTHSKVLYYILCFIFHTIPGYTFDFISLLLGKKTRMVKLYSKIHEAANMLQYFQDYNWTFSMENTKQLWQSLSAEDQRMFNFNMMSIDWSRCLFTTYYGMRTFLAKEDPTNIRKALQTLHRKKLLHHFVQILVCGCTAWVLWTIYSGIFRTLTK